MSESSEVESTAPADSFWEVGQFKVGKIFKLFYWTQLKPGNKHFEKRK